MDRALVDALRSMADRRGRALGSTRRDRDGEKLGCHVLHDIVDRAIQVHSALGFSTDMPPEFMYRKARQAGLVDGADEVHKVTVARHVLRNYEPREVPSEHVPTRRGAALRQVADALDAIVVSS